ncbi:hypothetical protein NIES4103_15880 [Nostoc sp. NIES-4103]|nr:hypothetical protein NIES4103_15880 [Nostoc sp. NIES-4103]
MIAETATLKQASADILHQAPLGRAEWVWGVGEEIAPITQGYRATPFQDDSIGGGSKPPPMQSSLHPTPTQPTPYS